MHRSLILSPSSAPSSADDVALARAASLHGYDTVWVGERSTASAPTRLAALAAATTDITLGLGLVALSARGAQHLGETVTTLGLVAGGRVSLGFSLPTALSAPARPAWVPRLEEAAVAAREAGSTVSAAADDVATAVHIAGHVDRVILRAADTALVTEVSGALSRLDRAPHVEVWLDLTVPGSGPADLRALVAERLAVPGVTGHAVARRIATRHFAGVQGGVEAAYARGELTEAADLVPDALVARTCLAGDTDALAARLQEYADAGASRIGAVPQGDAASRLAAVEAFGDVPAPIRRSAT